jgi:hypothetical protein
MGRATNLAVKGTALVALIVVVAVAFVMSNAPWPPRRATMGLVAGGPN